MFILWARWWYHSCVLKNILSFATTNEIEYGRLYGLRSLFTTQTPGSCFTIVSSALQDILLKFVYCRKHTSYDNFQLKLCTCAWSYALGSHTKFQLGILTMLLFLALCISARLFWRTSETLAKQPPDIWTQWLWYLLKHTRGQIKNMQ